jgi:hypothetical protein
VELMIHPRPHYKNSPMPLSFSVGVQPALIESL